MSGKLTHSLKLNTRQRRILAEFGIPGFISQQWALPRAAKAPAPTSAMAPKNIHPVNIQSAPTPQTNTPVTAKTQPKTNIQLNPVEDINGSTLPCPDGILARTFGTAASNWLFISEMPRNNLNHTQNNSCHALLIKMLAALDLNFTDSAFLIEFFPLATEEKYNDAVSQWLTKVIAALPNKIFVILGRQAGKIAFINEFVSDFKRQQTYFIANKPAIFTYSPEQLLINPHCKRPAWQDLQRARDIMQQLPT